LPASVPTTFLTGPKQLAAQRSGRTVQASPARLGPAVARRPRRCASRGEDRRPLGLGRATRARYGAGRVVRGGLSLSAGASLTLAVSAFSTDRTVPKPLWAKMSHSGLSGPGFCSTGWPKQSTSQFATSNRGHPAPGSPVRRKRSSRALPRGSQNQVPVGRAIGMLLRCVEDRDRLVQLSDVAEHGSAVGQRYAQLQHALAVTCVAPGRRPGTLLPGLDGRPHHGAISRTLRLQQQRLPWTSRVPAIDLGCSWRCLEPPGPVCRRSWHARCGRVAVRSRCELAYGSWLLLAWPCG
jgi:hypothetical protein